MPGCQVAHVDKKANLKFGFKDLSGRQEARAGVCQSPAARLTQEPLRQCRPSAEDPRGELVCMSRSSLSCRPGSEHELRVSLMKSMGLKYLL